MQTHTADTEGICPLCGNPNSLSPALTYVAERREKLYYVFCNHCRSYFTVRFSAYLRLLRRGSS